MDGVDSPLRSYKNSGRRVNVCSKPRTMVCSWFDHYKLLKNIHQSSRNLTKPIKELESKPTVHSKDLFVVQCKHQIYGL